MILEEKIYSNKEIAAFFSLNSDYFSKKKVKEKYLNYLYDYADWEVTKSGKIKINKVLKKEEFSKGMNPQERKNYILDKLIEEYYPHDFHCVIKELAEKFFDENKMKVKIESFYKHDCNNAFKDLFGKTQRKIEDYFEGLIGERKYIYTIYDEKLQDYRFLSREEEKIKREIVKKYYGTIDEKTAELKSHLEGEFHKGKISQEELKDSLYKMFLLPKEERYDLFMQEMYERVGIIRREFICLFKNPNEIIRILRENDKQYNLSNSSYNKIKNSFVIKENII